MRVKSNLHDEVERLIRLAGGEGIISPGDTVLLKPNLHAIQSYKRLRNRDKSNSHRIDVSRVVVELNKLIRPDLTVVDGTVGMEGMGPALDELDRAGRR